MENAPSVPGYDLVEVLGSGASGEVWRGRPAGGGADVAVKVVRGGEQAEREVAALRGVRHEHVVLLRDCVTMSDGSLALILDVAEGGTLAQLVRARGHLRPGEVVTVVAPLASTLAVLHERGIEHGDLAPGNVLFDVEGKPVLGDLGTVRITGEAREERFGTPGYVDPVVGAGGAPGPSSDVYSLGALAWYGLTGSAPPVALLRPPLDEVVPGLPPALVGVVEEALDPDPARRPDPAALARRVFDAVPAEPVWLVGRTPADGGLTHRIRQLAAADGDADAIARHRAPRRCRRHRVLGLTGVALMRRGSRPRGPVARRVTGAAAVALVATAAVTGVSLLRGGQEHGGSSAGPRAEPVVTAPSRASDVVTNRADALAPAAPALTAEQIRPAVEKLSRERAVAFGGGGSSGVALSRIAVPGSAAERQLRGALDDLRRQGVTYRGLTLTTRAVTVRGTERGAAAGDGGPDDGTRVVVDVVTDVSAYEVVDGRGNVRQRVGATPGASSTLVLARTDGGWRVADVRA